MGVFEANGSTLSGTWVSSTPATMVGVEKAWGKYFTFRCATHEEALVMLTLQRLDLGTPIVIECNDDMDSTALFGRFDGQVRAVLAASSMPVVICIGANIPAQTVVDWLRRGAFTYLERRSDPEVYEHAMAEAYQKAVDLRRQFQRFENLSQRWNSVTDREAIVLDMLLDGVPNKTIANRLGVSQRTIETRRHNLYEKLESRCVAELVRTIYELDLLDKTFRRSDNGHGMRTEGSRQRSRCERPLPKLHREGALTSE
jgi:DNA-binding NarL/FixJ family response regulator